MEGSYMPESHRVKVVNSARSAHFSLGKRKPEYSTTNQLNYRESVTKKYLAVGHSNVSHIQIATKNSTQGHSEFSSQFRAYSEEPRVRANIPSPSMHLSTTTGTYVTTSGVTYKSNGKIDRTDARNYQIKKRNVRNHHFNLGNEPATDYKSKATYDYAYITPENYGAVVESKAKISNSHALSDKPGCYVSTNFREFKPKELTGNIRVKKPEQQNFDMKNEGQEFVSMNQIAFSAKKAVNSSLTPDKLRELKNSHVNLGSSPENYAVSSVMPQYEVGNAKWKKASVSPNKMKFGEDEQSYFTNYSMNYSGRPKSQSNHVKISKKRDLNESSVVLGEENSGFHSQNNSTYHKVQISPSKLPVETEKNLRKHHFDLGSDDRSFKTTSQNYETFRIEKPFNIKDTSYHMKETNWKVGSYPVQHLSDFKKEFDWKGNSPHGIPQSKDIRKSHFQIGPERNTNWQSSYNGNYHWIQPVPDTNYKFSTMS